jgi:hypothetical protein
MTPRPWLSLACLLLISNSARAEGKLSWSISTPEWFQKLEITEDNGNQQGKLSSIQSVTPVSAIVVGEQLQINTGPQADSLDFKVDGKNTRYHGRFWVPRFTEFTSYIRDKGEIYIAGKVAEKIPVKFWMNSQKKTFYLNWEGVNLEVSSDPKAGPGACKGKVFLDNGAGGTLGTFTCRSSGSLEDTLFKNSHDVIAWLIHKLVVPDVLDR